MVLAKQNELTYMHFTVFSADGITPLTGQAGSCTSSLRKNGATTAEAVTIAEIGATGRYYSSFTPLAVAEYDLEVTCPDGRVMGDEFEVQAHDFDDLGTDLDTIEGKVDVVDTTADAILVDTADMQPRVQAIETDTNEIQGKLPTNEIMGSSTKADKDDEIDAILVDTAAIDARLPSDPADQSLVEAAISASESAIRGADSDDLKTISDQIDPVAIEANVEGHVTDALNTYDPPTKAELDTAETNIIAEVDANEAKIDALAAQMLRSLGLMFENHVMDDYSYTGTLMNSAIMYLYDTKAHAQTHDKVTGLIAKYTVTATYTGDKVTLFKVVLEP